MQLVSHVLQTKGSDVWSIDPDASVFSALKIMANKNVGALLVMDQGALVGVVSERDYARKIALEGKTSKDTPVKEIMSTQVICVRPDQTIEECMALMTDKRIRHLPVTQGDQLLGVLSIGDVVKAVIADREYTIEQLENYIAGRHYALERKPV